MIDNQCKAKKGFAFFALSLLAFAGMGFEVLLAFFIEPLVYGKGLWDFSTREIISHWLVTCIICFIVAFLLIMVAKKKRGDLGIVAGQYELFRSIYRFDYYFFAADAHEYGEFKVISFEKLFLLKTLSFKDSPHIEKLAADFHLMVKYYNTFRNKEYEEYSNKHIDSYLAAVNGVIYNDNYLKK